MSYGKTQAGQLAFKERSPLLSARQRAAFILFDSVKSLDQVLTATSGLGITQTDIDHMIGHGFLSEASPMGSAGSTTSGSKPELSAVPVSDRSSQERFSEAWPLATQLTASLGLRGFRLNLAVEAASGFDDLLTLFPKIQAAAGVEKSQSLERALKG